MEFADGGQVNDRDYMKTHNINVNEVWPVCSTVLDNSSDTEILNQLLACHSKEMWPQHSSPHAAQAFPCFLFLFSLTSQSHQAAILPLMNSYADTDVLHGF